MTDEPSCTIDPLRPCRSCLAEGPWVCPYPYLLAEEAVDEATDAPVVPAAGLALVTGRQPS